VTEEALAHWGFSSQKQTNKSLNKVGDIFAFHVTTDACTPLNPLTHVYVD